MPRRRPAPHAQQEVVRRFLQLDTSIRLAAAAEGLLPLQDERPESPAKSYPWDAELQHPKPKPATGPIKIGQLENVAAKPSLKTRSVSDPGDAHRLIARYVRNDEKSRSTVTEPTSPPSTPRAFPFPSMAMRRSKTLENFIEMESSATDTGPDDQLASKMGQILARRAAAVTRRKSKSSVSGRRSVDSNGHRSDTSRKSSKLKVDSTQEAGPSKSGIHEEKDSGLLDVPRGREGSKRESVVVDDRSPHEGGPFWRGKAREDATGDSMDAGSNSSHGIYSTPLGAQTGPESRTRSPSFSASRDSLRSYIFPVTQLASTHFGSQPPTHFGAQPPAHFDSANFGAQPFPSRLQIPTHPIEPAPISPTQSIVTLPQFQDDGQSFMIPASPASGVYLSPVESVGAFPGSPVRVPISPMMLVTPTTMRVQTSPMQFQASPTTMRVQGSPTTLRIQASPTTLRVQTSPTTRFQSSPVTRLQMSPIAHYQPSPTTVYSQPSPASSHPYQHQHHVSDAHVNLLRGLNPLPSRGLPLPPPQVTKSRPQSFALGGRRASRSDVFTSLLEDMVRQVTPPVREASPSPSRAPIREPTPIREPIPVKVPSPSPAPPTEPTTGSSSSPSPVTAPASPVLSKTPTPPASTPALFASPLAASSPIPPPGPTVFPTQSPSPDLARSITPIRFARTLSPLPPRLRRATPDPGSGSDEVVFRGRGTSSASSSPQKRKRRNRARLPPRAISESVAGRRVASESATRATVRRTAQSLMRRAHTGDDRGEVSSDGRDVVLFVPRSAVPPLPHSPLPAHQEPAPPPPPVIVEPKSRPVAPPLVRKESIPLPEATPYSGPSTLAPPGIDAVLSNAEPAGLPRKESIELQKPIIEPPPPPRSLAHLPWSPPRRVLSRPEMTSREGSFHTAPDSFVEDLATDAEFPSGIPGSFPEDARYVSTPVHMDLSELEEESVRLSMVTAEADSDDAARERATISSAMRGQVSHPVTMHLAPSPPRSATPARRSASRGPGGVLSGVFQPGFLVPPSPLAPSPLASSGSSRTPHSSSRTGTSDPHTASIPMVHDQSYSPPRYGLPRSVTPRTEASVRHPEDESFHSTHTADPMLRLPLDDWLEFAMSSMAAMGIPLTRATLGDLHESEDEGMAITEALSISSARGRDTDEDRAGILDGAWQADDDSSGDSLSQSLSDVGSTPSPPPSEPSRLFQAPYNETFSTDPAAHTSSARPTIDIQWEMDNSGRTSAASNSSGSSESARAVNSLQNIAAIVRDLNARTPIPSTTPPSHLPGPPSIQATSTPQPTTLSPGSVSITFSEACPSLPSVPPLVVLPRDRDRFADSLLLAEYRHSFQHLRDDDYRALDEGEDVVLYGVGGGWEQIARAGAESRAETESAVPIEFEGYDPASEDPQARNKYIQFLLSFAGALRTPGPNRPPRWVETALRSLRGQAQGSGPRYPSDLYDAIGRAEAELDRIPPPPDVPSHLSSTFVSSSSSSKSSSVGSALPEDDEIVEEYVRSILTPQPASRRPTPIIIEGPNIVPWPALPSPVSPRVRFIRSTSRQTARSQVTSITSATSPRSGYSSIIPPPPRPRARTMEPHWLAIYLAQRWPVPDTYVSRRTYSSPSALCPPMPYHWRPICHISPERLWEITNLAIRVDMPPPVQQPLAPSPEHDHVRQHFPSPAMTHGRATPYSARTSRYSSQSRALPSPPPVVYEGGRMTSHPNLPIEESQRSLSPVPPVPSPPPAALASRNRTPVVQRTLSANYTPRGSTDTARPTGITSRVVTPAGVARRRTAKDLLGRLMGKQRVRTHSFSSGRSPSPYIRSRLGFAGKVADVARRAFGHPRRRSRLSSIRSQRAARET